jgi:thiosulfate/3-mercaptopyruvate sulfurtransferase
LSAALIDCAELAARLGDPKLCLIEIAGNGQEKLQAYTAGHIPGAHPWRWKDWLWDDAVRDFPDPATFARRMGDAGIGNDTEVVLYGEDVQFGIYAWWVFRMCGHAHVRILDGARYRWKTEGRPLVTEHPPKRSAVPYDAPVRRDDSSRILRDELLRRLGEAGMLILDARSPEEYRGELVSPPGSPDVGAERRGRIPGAKPMYFAELLDADKRFRSASELRAAFQSRGAISANNIVAYCRLSHRATVLYFALTELLGQDNIRIYDGSWTEWGNLVGAPIER